MKNTFDDWGGQSLQHHGIPGMKWGVRKYQNEDGSLTAAGKARYGMGDNEGMKVTGARKMQRDFNNLDRGYANTVAEKFAANRQLNKRLNRTMKYAQKKGLSNDLEGNRKSDKKLNKLMSKTEKSLLKEGKITKQLKEIESLQLKIIQKASERGYTVNSKPFVRYGTTGKQRAAAILGGLAVGGAFGGAVVGGVLASRSKAVDGQKVKIRKNGNGKQELVNYAYVNEAERRKERNRRG